MKRFFRIGCLAVLMAIFCSVSLPGQAEPGLPRRAVEAEQADEAYRADGSVLQLDPNATRLSGTDGCSYVYYNIAHSNQITITYTSGIDTVFQIAVRQPDGSYREVGLASVPWNDASWTNFTSRSFLLQESIPDGAAVKITNLDKACDLDRFSFELVPSRTKVEAEAANEAYLSDGTRFTVDPNATRLAGTEGKSYVYYNIARSNRLSIVYTSAMDTVLQVDLLNADGTHQDLGAYAIRWNATDWTTFATKTVYLKDWIPEGATIRITNTDRACDLDYFVFESTEPRTQVEAESADGAFEKNGATVWLDPSLTRLAATDGRSYVYHHIAESNQLAITYTSPVGTTLQVEIQNEEDTWIPIGKVVLPKTTDDWNTFTTITAELDQAIPEGASVKITNLENPCDFDRFEFGLRQIVIPDTGDPAGGILPIAAALASVYLFLHRKRKPET